MLLSRLPSFGSVAPEYKDDLTSAAFASRLDELVESANVWIHGHTHASFDYLVGRCRVACNPGGYPLNTVAAREAGDLQFEDAAFNPQLVVEV